jgi:hypothetical protein
MQVPAHNFNDIRVSSIDIESISKLISPNEAAVIYNPAALGYGKTLMVADGTLSGRIENSIYQTYGYRLLQTSAFDKFRDNKLRKKLPSYESDEIKAFLEEQKVSTDNMEDMDDSLFNILKDDFFGAKLIRNFHKGYNTEFFQLAGSELITNFRALSNRPMCTQLTERGTSYGFDVNIYLHIPMIVIFTGFDNIMEQWLEHGTPLDKSDIQKKITEYRKFHVARIDFMNWAKSLNIPSIAVRPKDIVGPPSDN